MRGDITMSMARSGAKVTYGDLMRLPDDGKRHELVDGVHYVTPSPFLSHQRVAGNVHFLLRQYLELHPAGEVFIAPLDIVLSDTDVVEPDVFFVSTARAGILTDKHVNGAPDLVVEVTSTSTARRDEGVKYALYDRVDVAEYWILDPATARARVFRRVDGRLALALELSADRDEALTTPLLPGLGLPLSRVFGR